MGLCGGLRRCRGPHFSRGLRYLRSIRGLLLHVWHRRRVLIGGVLASGFFLCCQRVSECLGASEVVVVRDQRVWCWLRSVGRGPRGLCSAWRGSSSHSLACVGMYGNADLRFAAFGLNRRRRRISGAIEVASVFALADHALLGIVQGWWQHERPQRQLQESFVSGPCSRAVSKKYSSALARCRCIGKANAAATLGQQGQSRVIVQC
mmetsp:Transcript_110649/g.352359  ORF Transcript_110649/g.352359 Transcript_110649/m.352359 type:complete len:206 (-) Transcript_110649:224-841(-)